MVLLHGAGVSFRTPFSNVLIAKQVDENATWQSVLAWGRGMTILLLR